MPVQTQRGILAIDHGRGGSNGHGSQTVDDCKAGGGGGGFFTQMEGVDWNMEEY